MFEKVFSKQAEIVFFANTSDEYAYSRIPDVDAIVINGEGSFHSCRLTSMVLYHILYRAKFHGKKCYLVNCTLDKIPDFYYLDDFDYIYTREPFSYKLAKEHTDKVKLVADICFLYSPKLYKSNSEGILVLDHVDDSKTGELRQFADTNEYDFDSMIAENVDEKKILAFFQKMNRYDFIATGRYHGAVFSVMLGKPFSGLTSNTWKIESFMDMLGLSKRATNRVNKLVRKKDNIYKYEYNSFVDKSKIEREYKQLCEL